MEAADKFIGKCVLAILVLFLWLPTAVFSQTAPTYKKQGRASFYAKKFQGRRTSNGERYHSKKMTAAHRTLPFGTLVKVTNLRNGRSVLVRINDRGPFSRGRLIDMSHVAATELGMLAAGTAPVEVEAVGMDAAPPEPPTHNLAQVPAPIPARTVSYTPTAHKPALRTLPLPQAPAAAWRPGMAYTPEGTASRLQGYGVQVGAFGQMQHAVAYGKSLVEKPGRQVFIMARTARAGTSFAVLSGRFDRRRQAVAHAASLRKEGIAQAFVQKYAD